MSASDLKGFGDQIKYVLCVSDRGKKCRENVSKAGLELFSLFTMEELKESEV